MTTRSGRPLAALTSWIAGFSAIAVTLAGCGGSHGSGPTTPPTNTPHISNLAVATAPQGCPVQGLNGKVRTVTLDFVDADGDERGGHVDLNLSTGGPSQSVSGAIPSNFVSISGATSGTITVLLCIAVIGGTATLDVSLTDTAGNASNTLSASVSQLQLLTERPGSSDAAKERPAIGLSPR